MQGGAVVRQQNRIREHLTAVVRRPNDDRDARVPHLPKRVWFYGKLVPVDGLLMERHNLSLSKVVDAYRNNQYIREMASSAGLPFPEFYSIMRMLHLRPKHGPGVPLNTRFPKKQKASDEQILSALARGLSESQIGDACNHITKQAVQQRLHRLGAQPNHLARQ